MSITEPFASALQAYLELKPELEQSGQNLHIPSRPRLEEVLSNLEPLPTGALFIGMAEDGLPLFLNLDDPAPGSILVTSDAGCGKTALLQILARSTDLIQAPGDLLFSAITGFPEEWRNLEASPNNLGIWPVYHAGAGEMLYRLVSWAGSSRRGKQTVLLLLDDLRRFFELDAKTRTDMIWLLENGPQCGIWPIGTVNASVAGELGEWTNYFHTHIFGHIGLADLAGEITHNPECDLSSIFPGVQFKLQRKQDWLSFWIPSLD